MNTTTTIVGVSSTVSPTLLAVPYIVNIWLGIFLWFIGIVGCIGNGIIFLSQPFRNQAYTVYLFAATVCDLFLMNLVVLTRALQSGFGIPVKISSNFMCKLRELSIYYFPITSVSYFACASIDRILSTQRSNKFRKWSNRLRLAYMMVIVIALFWFLVFCARLFLYQLSTKGQCSGTSSLYKAIDNYLEPVLIELCPLITVVVLAFFLRSSVRNTIQRQAVVVIAERQENGMKRSQLQQMGSQITLMLMLQSIVAIISFLPYGIFLLYSHITDPWYKTDLRLAIEDIISGVTYLFYYTFFSTSFYISIISSSGFRRQIKHIFRINIVHPLTATIATIPTQQQTLK